MQIQVDSTGLILGYGIFTADHDDPDISIVEIANSESEKFDRPGAKTLNADSTITVTPLDTSAEDAARAATEAQRLSDAQTIIAILPTQAAKDAFARILGL